MTIWAFGKGGWPRTWQIDNGNLDATTHKEFWYCVMGTIRDSDG